MLDDIIDNAISGSIRAYSTAEELYARVLRQRGGTHAVEFPDTAFFLPMIYAASGLEVRTLRDLEDALVIARSCLHYPSIGSSTRPGLEEVLSSAMGALYAREITLALGYIDGQEPASRTGDAVAYSGFLSDTALRSNGVRLVDGRIPGIAVIIGAAPDDDIALSVVRELQERNMLVLLAGQTGGQSVAQQLARKGFRLGVDSNVIPLGPGTRHVLYAIDWAIRVPLIFGGLRAGNYLDILRYVREKIPAFAIVMGSIDAAKLAAAGGAINLGIPVICDTEVPVIASDDICAYPLLDFETDHSALVARAMEVKGIRVVEDRPTVPISYGSVFEGERIRKEDTFIEFGGGRSPAMELVRLRMMDEIDDGKVTIVGEGWQKAYERGKAMPLGILVEVAARKAGPEFRPAVERRTRIETPEAEKRIHHILPIIERKLHGIINEGQGLWHMGQRDSIWVRVSHSAKDMGFSLEDLGKIVYAMISKQFRSVVDKIQVTLIVGADEVQSMQQAGREIWRSRDERLEALTDETVDTFYSCLLCQSFAPSHICVITPERPGLCGSYNWLDARAAHALDSSGGNQPIDKGTTLDSVMGRWSGVDEYINRASGGAVQSLNAYSIMDMPMTSCGCFQCIVAILPEANGLMIVDRGYSDITPLGLKFSTLAATVGGGVQSPGFMGVSVNFITSRKFLHADGGLKRVVWMNSALKEMVKDQMDRRAELEGMPGMRGMIADETVARDIEGLVKNLESIGHPALQMSALV